MCEADPLLNKYIDASRVFPDEFILQCERLGGWLPAPANLTQVAELHSGIQDAIVDLGADAQDCLDSQVAFTLQFI